MRSRCPATIFAARRTERVKGRITLLTISIKTIKGIRAGGVPKGTRCANIALGVRMHPISIWPSHRGSAKATVKVKCLEEVNTKGNSPKALLNKIKTISAIGTKVSPGALTLPKMALNSEFKNNFSSLNKRAADEGRDQ